VTEPSDATPADQEPEEVQDLDETGKDAEGVKDDAALNVKLGKLPKRE